MSFIDKMKEAGEDIKEAFQDGAHDLADKVSSNLSRYHRSPGLVPAISKRRYRE